ncbi:MAG: RHS repeat-associated core domain-containing protein, partial [Coriobacteriia bacterium]|nr:RHS repeat-associated core domain-containing protein [Coriobacteriia bacterium]
SQRHYDPATMRFLTKDPARDDGEESAYQYCAGDPVGKVDPTGMWSRSFTRVFSISQALRALEFSRMVLLPAVLAAVAMTKLLPVAATAFVGWTMLVSTTIQTFAHQYSRWYRENYIHWRSNLFRSLSGNLRFVVWARVFANIKARSGGVNLTMRLVADRSVMFRRGFSRVLLNQGVRFGSNRVWRTRVA